MTPSDRGENGTPASDVDPADVARLQRQAMELLTQLDQPPRNLRIQAVSVDVTWASEQAADPPRPLPPPDAAPPERVGSYLTSPGVGVFYHAKEPGAEPFVSVGSRVQPGQQIGIIEAMKLMIPVEADRAGVVTEVIKGNGQPVEFAEPLFALDRDEE